MIINEIIILAKQCNFDEDTLAMILAEASLRGWKATAKKYGITTPTFFRYKAQLKTNPSLKQKYEQQRLLIMAKSHEAADDFLTTLYRKLTEKINNDEIKLTDPRVINALALMSKNASEYKITQSVLDGLVDDGDEMN